MRTPCTHTECRGHETCNYDNSIKPAPVPVERVDNVLAEDVFNAATEGLSNARAAVDAAETLVRHARGTLATAQLTWERAKTLLLDARKVSP